ncbi:MAG: A/G-specific adenine glycosylase, partial [Lachnospiraceae bacterium]|nr:A/G-specific adenine glycosylase [Lachnospiraceae bacterium]
QNSRFDFYVECGDRKIFIEVKGVTLENGGEVRFPDAPSQRAVKHVEELVKARQDGYEAYVLFVIQMEKVKYFLPNDKTDPKFAKALWEARRQGVNVLAYDCVVTEDTMEIDKPVPVYLADSDRMVEPLLSWFQKSARVLPWRQNPTAYNVWISEIMLQQTRVEAVKPYYDRFMKLFPDVYALANAEEEVLLKAWEGLGYYNRVRNLKKAAIEICEKYNGKMPDSYEEIIRLSGIGSYTAGAVLSIAYNKKFPAVDGNVLRVLSRIRGDYRDILDAKVKKEIEEEVRSFMPREASAFNQAMMELGAMVCVPNGAPKCEVCPVSEFCYAKAHGCSSSLPVKAPKKKRIIEKKTVLIIQDGNKTVLKKRPDEGLLAGMYEFPMLEGEKSRDEVLEYLKNEGFGMLRIKKAPDGKHIFSHKEWHMTGYVIKVDELEPFSGKDEFLFVETNEAQEKYPLPSAFKVYTRYLSIKTGKENFTE